MPSAPLRQRYSTPCNLYKPLPSKPKTHPSLLSWDALPLWSKDNSYIKTGYRPTSYSYTSSFLSCFYLHNETGNIYTHFLATIWMIALPVIYYPYIKRNYPSANLDDCIIFGLFFLGGALCFGLSTLYHILSNHSHAVHDIYHRLDLLGISIVTAGCFPPGMWYTFPCAPRSTKVFWISVRINHLRVPSIYIARNSLIRRFSSILPRKYLPPSSCCLCAACASRHGVLYEGSCSHSWLRRHFTLLYTLASRMDIARWILRQERAGMLALCLCI